jgi:hypothetical protein
MTLPTTKIEQVIDLPTNSIQPTQVPQNAWNAVNSIQICQELLRRGTAANISLGLELARARYYLKHGYWYSYLGRIGIDHSGATRRMALAEKYLQKSGLLSSVSSDMEQLDEFSAIEAGIKLISANRAELHGLEKEDLWNAIKNCKPIIRVAGIPTQSLFGFSLSRLSNKISNSLSRRLGKSNWLEAVETLEMESNILNGWAEAMLELAQQCSARAKEIRDDLKKSKANRYEWKLKSSASNNKENGSET